MLNVMSRCSLLSLALALAATGCRTGEKSAPAGSAGDFELTGSRIIACCCASPCPCRINKKPMLCHGCDHTDAVRIEKGRIGSTRVDGLVYALIGRVFAEKEEDNWTYVYVSDKATDEQVKALQGMLEADVKAMGPKAKHLAGKFLGMRKVPLTYHISADRREHGATIPGILELKTRAIVNPGRTEPVVSTGILDAFGDRFIHAECVVHKYQDPQINYSWDLTGRQSNHTDFVLDSKKAAQGGVGWGCWTAHAELGATGKYQEQMLTHE